MNQATPAPEQQEDVDPTTEEQTPDAGEVAAARIADLEKQLAAMKDQALRALAEAENTRKRSDRDRQDTAKFSVSSFAKELLTVADNLRRALSAITPEQQANSPELKNIYTGVEATERELLGLFERNGIKKIEPLGNKFDANLHEVLFEIDAHDKPPGIVMQVIEPGYTIHERLLRPARVGVSKGGEDMQPGSTVDKQV